MKTQNELQKMNDQQLTFELACLVFGKDECYMSRCLQVAECTSGAARYVDLNDWSWIMPLAVENGLGYSSNEVSFNAFSCDDLSLDVYADTPQRAIAICLVLKLQEVAE